ncbi:Hypothetical predicted protein [Cloeon dipterum]|uniref:TIL domain-containing protein n=1 Tax=Cloeon dipterum TaxID=197152 RepID=A0A8S1CHW7_9INSE|nr:Hypothetical predicted protein [Cloeon dipterum]
MKRETALFTLLLLLVVVVSAAQARAQGRSIDGYVRTPGNQQAQCAFCNPSGPRSCPSGCRFDRNRKACVPSSNCRNCRCR